MSKRCTCEKKVGWVREKGAVLVLVVDQNRKSVSEATGVNWILLLSRQTLITLSGIKPTVLQLSHNHTHLTPQSTQTPYNAWEKRTNSMQNITKFHVLFIHGNHSPQCCFNHKYWTVL